MNKIHFILLVLIIGIFGCSDYKNGINVKKVSDNPLSEKVNKGEDFKTFYIKFTSDSLFQLDRVKFPLKGEFIDYEEIDLDKMGDKSKPDFVWQKKDWKHLYSFDDIDTTLFEVKEIITDSVVKKIILGKSIGYKVEETFKLIECKWYLVHFINYDI